MFDLMTAILICTGQAPTVPVTNIELEVKPSDVYSTIRFEFAEGSLAGTAYIQSVGALIPHQKGSQLIYASGDGPNSTRLVLQMSGQEIRSAKLSHFISGMKETVVECSVP